MITQQSNILETKTKYALCKVKIGNKYFYLRGILNAKEDKLKNLKKKTLFVSLNPGTDSIVERFTNKKDLKSFVLA